VNLGNANFSLSQEELAKRIKEIQKLKDKGTPAKLVYPEQDNATSYLHLNRLLFTGAECQICSMISDTHQANFVAQEFQVSDSKANSLADPYSACGEQGDERAGSTVTG
jgi:hypothetical protein